MRRQHAIVAVAVLVLITSLITLTLTLRILPDRVAVHWGLTGEPDNFVAAPVAWAVTGGVGGLAALLTGLVAAVVPARRNGQLWAAAGLFCALLFVGLSVLVTVANAGDREPRLSLLGVLAVIVLCLVIPVVLVFRPGRAGRLELGRAKTAEVLCRSSARSRFALPVFVAFLAAGVLAGIWNVVIGVVVAVAGLAVLSLVEIRVEVTRDAVRVRYSGPLGWPASKIPMEEIRQAEAIAVDPRRYGGWGYRGSLALWGRAAVNLRRGPGIRFVLRDGRIFVVTVDEAEATVHCLEPLLLR